MNVDANLLFGIKVGFGLGIAVGFILGMALRWWLDQQYPIRNRGQHPRPPENAPRPHPIPDDR